MTQGFFGNQISARLSETPEGFLIAQGAVLARSGWQTYRGAELNLPDFNGLVEVYRPVSEVLARSFISSLEGKCIVDEHPTEFVDTSNARWVCAGHCQNIRKGPNLPNGDVTVVGDLIVTDESLIRKIAGGKRELSVGYLYGLRSTDDGGYEMHDLIANHVAVVDQGRAGPACAILDHAVQQGRPCHCQKELERLAPANDVKQAAFAASARRFLGRNVLEVAEQRKNR